MFENKLYTKIINSLTILVFLALPLVSGVRVEAANSLSKSGTASSPVDSTTNVDRGGTIDWTIDLDSDGSTELKLQDMITGNQEYVPGSLVLPSVNDSAGGIDYSWNSSFYDDLGCSTTDLESTDTKCLEAVSDGLMAGGANGFGGSIISPPATTVNAGTGGDGYVPVIYEGKIYAFYHYGHANAINCIDMATSATCSDGSWPSYFSSDLGSTLGTGTQDIWSGYFNEVVQNGNYAYYVAQRQNDVGIGCVDLDTYTNCGYTQLASLSLQPTANSLDLKAFTTLANPISYQGKIYSFGKDGNFYCADITTAPATVCSGYPVVTSTPALTGKFLGQQQLIGDKVYYLVKSYNANNEQIGCFDLTTNADCLGFSANSVAMNNSSAFIRNIITTYDTSMNPTGFCILFDKFNFANPPYKNFLECFDFSGNIVAAPDPNFFAGINLSSNSWRISGFEEEIYGTKLYYPLAEFNGGTSRASCWDFSINAACVGFGGTNGYISAPQSNTKDYGYTEYNGCMYALGDGGILWSFDAETGVSPCARSMAMVNISDLTTTLYCDGEDHSFSWNRLELNNTTNMTSATAVITDSSNQSHSYTIDLPSGVLDLTTIATDLGLGDDLSLSLDISFSSPVNSSYSLYYDGDPAQACFQTRVIGCGTAETIDNTAYLFDPVTDTELGSTTSNSFAVEDLACPVVADQVDLAVIKTSDKYTYQPGEDISFELEVFNNLGGSDLLPSFSIDLVDDLFAAGLNLISVEPSNPMDVLASNWDCSASDYTDGIDKVDCTYITSDPAQSLAMGQSLPTLRVVARATTTGVYDNVVNISSPQEDPDNATSGNNTDNQVVEVAIAQTPPDLTLLKDTLPATTDPELATWLSDGVTEYSYSLTPTLSGAEIVNSGGTSPIRVLDNLPPELTMTAYPTGSDAVNWDCSASSLGSPAILDCNYLGSYPVSPATLESIIVTVTLNPGVDPNTTITNTATVSSTEEPVVNQDNNSDSEEIGVLGVVDLELTKSVNNPTPLPLDQVTWSITVSNNDTGNGLSDATGVVVEDIISGLAPDLVYFSHSITDAPSASTIGSFDPLTGVWNIGDIPSGEETTLEITMDLSANATGTIKNLAQVTGLDQVDIDSDPNDNTSAPDPDSPSDPGSKPVTTTNPTGLDLHDDEDNAEITLLPTPDLTITKDTLPATTDPELATWLSDGVTEYSYSLTPALSGAEIVNSGGTSPIRVLDNLPPELTMTAYPTGSDAVNWDCSASSLGSPAILDCNYLGSYPVSPATLESIIVTVTLNPGVDPSTTITNTATVSSTEEPVVNQDNNSDSEEIGVLGVVDLELTKSVDNPTPLPLDQVTWSITVSNNDTGNGLSDATGVVVEDIISGLAPDLVYFSHSITDAPSASTIGSFDPLTGVWNIGDIPSGEETTLEITMDLSANATGTIKNLAQVTGLDQVDIDSDPNDNTSAPDPDSPSDPGSKPVTTTNPTGLDLHDDEDNAEITLLPTPDLTITKDTLPATTDPELATWLSDGVTEYSYSLTPALSGAEIVNSGGTSPIRVLDNLPPELTMTAYPTGSDAVNWDCSASSLGSPAILDCNYLGSYPVSPATLESIIVTVTLNPGVDPNTTITNTATVSSTEEPVVNQDNNSDSEEIGVLGVVDLELTKSVNNPTPLPLDQVTWSITVSNNDTGNGLSDATGVVVEDIISGLAPDLVYFSHSITDAPSAGTIGSFDPLTGVWNIGDIPSGEETTLEITMDLSATATGTIKNLAQVTGLDQVDIDSDPNDNTSAPDPDSPSDPGSKPVTTTNPTGLDLHDDEDNAEITLLPTPDLTITKDTLPATTDPELATWLSDGVTEYSYSLTPALSGAEIVNSGGTSPIRVLDNLPPELTMTAYPTGSDAVNWDCSASSLGSPAILDCNYLGSYPVSPATLESIIVTVTLNPGVDPSTTITNTATVSSTEEPVVNQDNNSDSEEIGVLGVVDLELTKSVDNPTPLPLDQVTWSITVSNNDTGNGLSDATGVVVEDIISGLAPDLVYFSHSITDAPSASTIGSFDPLTGVWNIGDIPSGEETTLEITMDLSANATGTIKNLAQVTGLDQVDIDSDPNDNTSAPDPDSPSDPGSKPVTTTNPTGLDLHDDEDNAEITPLANPPDLTITKDTLPATTDPELATWLSDGVTEYSYSLTPALSGAEIVNSGGTSPIRVLDNLPPELTMTDYPTGSDAVNWDCSASSLGSPAILDCNYLGSYPVSPATLESIIVTVTLNPGVDPNTTITNTATVSSTEEPVVNQDNNSDSEEIGVLGVVDLELTKSVDNPTPLPLDQVTWSITVSNNDTGNGLSDATGVVVEDIISGLAPDLVYFSHSITDAPSASTIGSFDPLTGVWNIGDIPSGEETTLEITMDLSATATGTIKNLAQVTGLDQVDIDSDPNDNTSAPDPDSPSDPGSKPVTTTNPTGLDLHDDEDNAEITLLPTPDLTITKDTLPATTDPELATWLSDGVTEYSYSLTPALSGAEIVNSGGTSPIRVLDNLPPELTMTAYPTGSDAVNWDCSASSLGSPAILDCNYLGSYPVSPATLESIIVTVTLNPGVDPNTTITNTATVSSTEEPVVNQDNNSDSEEILTEDPILPPDPTPMVGIAKDLGTVVDNGDGSYNLPFILTVKNYGLGEALGVDIADDLLATFVGLVGSDISISSPVEISPISSNLTANPNYNGTTDTSLTIPASSSLAPDEMAILYFTARVNNLTLDTRYDNTATIKAIDSEDNTYTDDSQDGLDPDDDQDSNLATDGNGDPTDSNEPTPILITGDQEPIPEGDLAITKELVAPSDGKAKVGDSLTYKFVITNNSDFDVDGPITVVDSLPAGLTYAGTFSSGASGYNCTGATTITCIKTSGLLATSSEQLFVNVVVSSYSSSELNNTVVLTTQSIVETTLANNSDVAGVQITQPDPTPILAPIQSKDINPNSGLPSTGVLSHPVTQLLLLISILSIPALLIRQQRRIE